MTTRIITLWGGPLDGVKVRVLDNIDCYTAEGVQYRPALPGDFALGMFRYVPKENA